MATGGTNSGHQDNVLVPMLLVRRVLISIQVEHSQADKASPDECNQLLNKRFVSKIHHELNSPQFRTRGPDR